MPRLRSILARLLVLPVMVPASQAAVLHFSDYDASRSTGIYLSVNGQEQIETAGVMTIQVNGGPNLDAFCADLFTGIANNNAYTASLFSATSAPYTRVAWLMATILPTILSGSGTAQQQGAALQVAIWDIIHDNGDGLSAGLIQTSANTNAGVAAYVNSYLAASWTPTLGLNLYHNTFPNTTIAAQDLVTFSTAVPEPSTRALLSGVVLVALGIAGRKQYHL